MPRWRKATWALLIFNALMAWWLIASLHGTGSNCAGTTADQLAACQVGTGIGVGVVVFVIGALWFVGFLVLSLVWLMSRQSKRLCPRCGRPVKVGLLDCPACLYSFVDLELNRAGAD